MNLETYEGWTNRETWLVNLWLNNDQGLHEDARAAANVEGEMLQEAAQSIEDYVEEMIGNEVENRPFVGDLVTAALARVNWSEIAQGFREP